LYDQSRWPVVGHQSTDPNILCVLSLELATAIDGIDGRVSSGSQDQRFWGQIRAHLRAREQARQKTRRIWSKKGPKVAENGAFARPKAPFSPCCELTVLIASRQAARAYV
jgi:hypothetical protein